MRVLEAPILLNPQILNPPLVSSSRGLFLHVYSFRVKLEWSAAEYWKSCFVNYLQLERYRNDETKSGITRSLLVYSAFCFPFSLKRKFIIAGDFAVSKLINQLCFRVLQDSVVDPAVLFSMYVARKRIFSFNIAQVSSPRVLY